MGSTSQEQEEKPAAELARMMINVLVISVAFTFLFTAYQSTANLQSSINTDAGLGTASLSTIYVALILSCIFVPTWMISKLGVKWTMPVCMLGYGVYIGAQFYPEFYTLIPAAIVVGLVAAPMWSAKCTYLTQVGTVRAKALGTSAEVQVTRLFGIFFLLFQCSQVIGNLISSTVLSSGYVPPIDPEDPNLPLCGARFCPWEDHGGSSGGNRPSDEKIYTLFGIYLGCALIAAAIIAAFVDPLTRFGERTGSGTGISGFRLLLATGKHLKDKRQLLLIPLTVFSGLEQGYIGADFTQSFVTCAYGVQNVGYVMICFGVCDAVFSLVFGELIKIVGRIPIFTLGAAINIAMICTMFFWKPMPDEPAVFFVIAGFWGVSDAVWQTQMNALYGNLFQNNEEAAFSNYRLWESLGFAVAYAYSTFLCTDAKMWVLVGVLILGMAGYYGVEFIEKRSKQEQQRLKSSNLQQ
ncbi:UNC93-like protein [Neocloeon triangulifer]|uniref:UNC93-like protein n=1 Tax=Neocloeon triangulifer TaxID=2078957 RepID=UPI00286F67B8|nr:UNC93-like protein [Neocloeon triangulifer]